MPLQWWSCRWGEKKRTQKTNCWESPVCSSSTYFIHVGQILSDLCSKLGFFCANKGIESQCGFGSRGCAGRPEWLSCPVLLNILFMQGDYWLTEKDPNAGFIPAQTPWWREGPVIRLCKDDFWRRLRSGPTTVKSVSRNSISQAEVMRLRGHCASLSLSAPLHVKHSDYLFIFTLNPSLSQGRALI